jgi:hypothetical protein
LAAIDQLKTDKMFDNSSDYEVSVLLKKISAMANIFLEITSKKAEKFVSAQKDIEN